MVKVTQSHPSYRIVGTAGHIDHGKSALVKALSGTDPDRLQEEQERGITIDLGFADTRLHETRVAFIDVPGHERFVKNMLAGIGGIDAVLLVVAADESIMPQTREHFAICRLLGVEHGVVAITKCDLADPELQELVELEVHELLEGTPMAGCRIVRTSATTGDGLDELRDALAQCLEATPARSQDSPLRLPIDRTFSVKGFGTVVTGTLMSGVVRSGDTVELFPTGREVTVRGVQVHGENTASAAAGQRTALNLQGIGVDAITRGDAVIVPGSIVPSFLLDVHLEVLPGYRLQQMQRVRFHHGAAEILGRLALLTDIELPPGGSGYAQLRLERPCAARPGDRFILRRYSPLETMAGGSIVDIAPSKHRRGRVDVEALERFHHAGSAERVVQLLHRAGVCGAGQERLSQRLGLSEGAVREAMQEAVRGGAGELIGQAPHFAVERTAFEALQTRILDAAAAYHRRFPLRPAAPKEDLRVAFEPTPSDMVFEAAARRLVASEQLRRDADGYALTTHLARIPPAASELSRTILERFERGGLAPPSLDEALTDPQHDTVQARELLHYLLRSGDLVRVRDDLVFHGEAIAKLVDALQGHFHRGQQFSVADFKEWARISRKYAIPLLEYLDTRRITRRVGDARERM